ncbi:MAG: DNA internalization-related competence protein ComEC/Rec2 [Planctomycetaceae bacterium]|nr:DNA internalization-related competence protein ComEC/Rec2 [Planctomycetaceae bacterium]
MIDRSLTIDLSLWLISLGVLLLLGWCFRRIASASRGVVPVVLLMLIALGGARHHLTWSTRPPDNVTLRFAMAPQLVQIRGQVLDTPTIDEAEHSALVPAWMQLDRTLAELRCMEVCDHGHWTPVSGVVRLEVAGHLLGVRAGDYVELMGEFERPRPPRNPGGFQYAEYLKSQGLGGTVRCNHPLSVQVRSSSSGLFWQIVQRRSALRALSVSLIQQQLPGEVQPLAASLLLGDRGLMTDELRTQFAESGTMHLLAISGLHVGILIGLTFLCCRLLNLGPLATTTVLLAVALGYAAFTISRPPVLRAVLLTVMLLGAALRQQRAHGLNLLGAAAAILLLWHPSDLFDIGAQLSFLAVWAIIVSASWWDRLRMTMFSEELFTPQRSGWRRVVEAGFARLGQAYLMTAAIWLSTLPLTMSQFHLVSPIGFVINVLLIPLTALILASGFLFLLIGLLTPSLAAWFAWPFGWLLQLLLGSVAWASSVGWGHWSVPGIPWWWLVSFYILLAGWWRLVGTARTARWSARLLLMWVILGLGYGLLPIQRTGLRCTFIAVGHGNAVLLELPDGRNLLYDAGSFGHGHVATRIVESALWERGIARLDAIVLSHPDVDHFNAVHGLVQRFPVGSVVCGRSFLDFRQEAVVDMCESVTQAHVPIRLIQAGDLLVPRGVDTSETELRILHPADEWRSDEDNANSVVLLVEYANRRLLLTGDLDGDGLMELLTREAGPFDLMLAPHHGSRKSNPVELYDWARPETVIASTANPPATDLLRAMLASHESPVPALWNTATSGAVTVTILPEGAIEVSGYLD